MWRLIRIANSEIYFGQPPDHSLTRWLALPSGLWRVILPTISPGSGEGIRGLKLASRCRVNKYRRGWNRISFCSRRREEVEVVLQWPAKINELRSNLIFPKFKIFQNP